MRIYKRSDRIPIKIGDITIKVGPLSLAEKAEIGSLFFSGKVADQLKATLLTIKYGVKEVEGFFTEDGPYQLSFEGEYLTDDCASELINTEAGEKMVVVCTSLIKKIPDVFTDEKGNKLEGVEILKKDKPVPNA